MAFKKSLKLEYGGCDPHMFISNSLSFFVSHRENHKRVVRGSVSNTLSLVPNFLLFAYPSHSDSFIASHADAVNECVYRFRTTHKGEVWNCDCTFLVTIFLAVLLTATEMPSRPKDFLRAKRTFLCLFFTQL